MIARLVNGLLLSATLAVVTALVAGVVGSMAAYALTRTKSRFAELIRSLHTAPVDHTRRGHRAGHDDLP